MLGTFTQSTNLCSVLGQGPQHPLGNSSCSNICALGEVIQEVGSYKSVPVPTWGGQEENRVRRET